MWRKKNPKIEKLENILDEKNKQLEEKDKEIQELQEFQKNRKIENEEEDVEVIEEELEEEKEEFEEEKEEKIEEIPIEDNIPLSIKKNKKENVYVIKNWYVFPRSPNIIEERKAKTYYIPREDWEVIIVHDLDRFDISQLVHTALYGKRKISIFIIIAIAVIVILLITMVLYAISLIFRNEKNLSFNSPPPVVNYSDIGANNNTNNEKLNENIITEKKEETRTPPSFITEERNRNNIEIINENKNQEIDEQNKNPPSIIENPPKTRQEQFYENSNPWILEAYNYNENINQPICDNSELITKNQNLENQNQILISQNEKLRSENIKINNLNKDLQGTGFSCYIWKQIEKNCKLWKNNELCKNLYYKYKIDESE